MKYKILVTSVGVYAKDSIVDASQLIPGCIPELIESKSIEVYVEPSQSKVTVKDDKPQP